MAKHEAYRIFKKLLKQSMKYAFLNPPPPIVSPALREISNKLLTELCRIHCVCVPKRNNTDKKSIFMLNLADWAAILISNIYYEVDVHETNEKNRILNEISKISVGSSEKEETGSEEEEEEKEEDTDQKDEDEQEVIMGPAQVAGAGGQDGLETVTETEEESDSPNVVPESSAPVEDEPETGTEIFEYE